MISIDNFQLADTFNIKYYPTVIFFGLDKKAYTLSESRTLENLITWANNPNKTNGSPTP